MSDVMNKALLCGLGLASLTKEAIHKAAEDLVRRSRISEEEGRRLVKDLAQRSKKAREALEKEVDAAVHEAFQHLDPAAIIKDRLKNGKPAAKPAAKAAKKSRRTGGARKAASH